MLLSRSYRQIIQHRRLLLLLERALRYDIHFISRHPTTLFQCIWNRGWWFDHPKAAEHYDSIPIEWTSRIPPWNRPEPERLSAILQDWQEEKRLARQEVIWLRTLRPPPVPLGAGLVALLVGHERKVTDLAWAPGGRLLASGSEDGSVRIWEIATSDERAILRGHELFVHCLAWSPDAYHLASGGWDRRVRIWDVVTGSVQVLPRGNNFSVTCLAYSPDGQLLAAGSDNSSISVWDTKNGALLFSVVADENDVPFFSGITQVVFEDEERLVTEHSSRRVQVWDVRTGAELARWSGKSPSMSCESSDATVQQIADNPLAVSNRLRDSRRLSIKAWHIVVQKDTRSFDLSPDGHKLAVGKQNGTVQVWDGDAAVQTLRPRGDKRNIKKLIFSLNQ